MAEERSGGQHPSKADLRAFLGGTLQREDVARVVRHLVPGCSACRAAVASLRGEAVHANYDFSIARAFAAVRRRTVPIRTVKPKYAGLNLATLVSPRTLKAAKKQFEVLFRAARDLQDDPKTMVLISGLAVAMAEELELDGERVGILELQARAWAELGNSKRIANDLMSANQAFSLAYERLRAAGREGSRDAWLCARILDLDASLRRYQRRFSQAVDLLDCAIEVYLEQGDRQAAGRALVKQGTVFLASEDFDSAVTTTLRGLDLMDYRLDPTAFFKGVHNMVFSYASAGEHREARAHLVRVRRLYEIHSTELNDLRVRVLEGRIAAGLGEFLPALHAYTEARDGFADRDLPYDAALVSLELCLLWLEHGQYENVSSVLGDTLAIFYTLDIAGEAAAAVVVLYEAARQGQITEALVRSTAKRLEEIQFEAARR